MVSTVHGVDGQKTDQAYAAWLAELLQCGLLKSSFVPPQDVRELRDLTRMRVALLEDQNRVQNRIEKILEDANIKLGSVASDTLGTSGTRIIQAIVKGDKDPGCRPQAQPNADLIPGQGDLCGFAPVHDYAQGRLRAKRKELEESLRGRVTDHHRRLLDMLLRQSEFLDREIERIETEIRERLAPRQDLVDRLAEIPGFGEVTAWTVLAKIGFDMNVFRTPERLCSWAGMCPDNRKSAWKRKSGKTRKGNRWLRRGLTQTGLAASNSKNSCLRSFYWRIAARTGAKKAHIAKRTNGCSGPQATHGCVLHHPRRPSLPRSRTRLFRPEAADFTATSYIL